MGKRKHENLPQEMGRSYWLRGRPNPQTPSTSSRQSKALKPETFAGSQHVIIEQILQHLQFQDLLKCRLVNSKWTSIATARLTRLNTHTCYFEYHYIQKRYVVGKKKLSDLIECARKSVTFPSTSFKFRAGDMCSEDAKEFLTVMGHSVKTLTLFAVNNASLAGNMNLTTIINHTPNLETLIFEGGSYYDFKATDRLILPSLKHIQIACTIESMKTGIKLILEGAPNLEKIDGAWRLVDGLEAIVTMNKIHTIKRWCPTKFSFPAGLIQLATAAEDELALNELVFYIGEHNVQLNSSVDVDVELLWKCFQKILNKNSIQKLILNCSKFLVNSSFPLNMDNVKELVLMPKSHPEKLRHFPLNINLNSTFPQLNILSFYDPLYRVCCAGADWNECFPLAEEFEDFNEILPTVTILNLRGKSTSIRMLQKMKKLCPNVQNLEIYLSDESDKMKIIRELCGEWRHLKKLSINFDDCELKLKDNLDRVFIGSLTKAKKSKKAEDAMWIGNIRGLIQLDIKYTIPHGSYQSKDKILIPFTKSSGQYAFNLMPKLAVNLHYLNCYCCTDSEELKKALHSISPFASINRR